MAARIIVVAICLSLSAAAIAGPIFPTRSFIVAPAFRSSDDTTTRPLFLHQQGIWGDLARGYQSANDRFGWSIAFGGVIQFVEWQHSQIYLIGDAEVLSDTHNDISFNPRAIFWTEGVVYSDKIDATEVSVGYIHRCHHDLDDLDNNVASNHEERTLIYGSAMGRVLWRDLYPIPSAADLHASAFVQLDQYLIRQDDRIPEPADRGTDVAKLNTSISVGAKLLKQFADVGTYVRAGATGAWYDGYHRSTADFRVELGLEFSGAGTRMNVFAGFEHLDDDYNSVVAVRSAYGFVGFRFIGQNVGI